MRYIIYELVTPSHLNVIESGGYYPKVIEREVLQKLDITAVNEEHPSFESAVAEIEKKSTILKGYRLTVLPVFSVAYDGEIY